MKLSKLATCATGCGHIEVCHLVGDAYTSEMKRLGYPVCRAQGIVPRPFGHVYVAPTTAPKEERCARCGHPVSYHAHYNDFGEKLRDPWCLVDVGIGKVYCDCPAFVPPKEKEGAK